MYFCSSECARLAVRINKFEDAYCARCNFRIDKPDGAFVTQDGKYFCCINCALTHEGVYTEFSSEGAKKGKIGGKICQK